MSADTKSEKPTEHKLKKAKKDGDVPRSKELPTMLVILSFISGVFVMASGIADSFSQLLKVSFSPNIYLSDGISYAISPLLSLFKSVSILCLWFLAHLFIGTLMLGGFIFTPKKLAPKIENLSWKKGVKKLISKQNVFEASKALLKLIIIGSISYLFIHNNMHEFIEIRWSGRQDAITYLGETFTKYLGLMTIILAVFCMVDVPLQVSFFRKKMMMSHKEIKDEFKETEGSPEIKGKIKQKQREASERKNLSKAKEATVVFANPTHFSVAIKFDPISKEAPTVVSMGADYNAFRVREIATANHIPILAIPPLARALYNESSIGEQIPQRFYQPVATILAYLMDLDDRLAFDLQKIKDSVDL